MSVAGLTTQLTRANRTYRAHFLDAAEKARAQYEPIISALCMREMSSGPGNDYNFGDAVATMQVWDQDRPIVPIGAKGFQLENVNYANGVEIDRNDFDDDRVSVFVNQIRNLPVAFWWLLMSRLRTLFNAGFTATHYDGVAFFSDSHPNDGNTNDNLSTDILDEAALMAAITQLRNMKTTNGEYMNLNPTHLIYGNDLEWVARDLLKQTVQATGETNVIAQQFQIQPLQIPGITTARWGVADLSWNTKPFIKQERSGPGPAFTGVTNPEAPDVYHRRKFHFGADWRGAMGYGHYQFIVGSTGAS